jgi:hypothetical protein
MTGRLDTGDAARALVRVFMFGGVASAAGTVDR